MLMELLELLACIQSVVQGDCMDRFTVSINMRFLNMWNSIKNILKHSYY